MAKRKKEVDETIAPEVAEPQTIDLTAEDSGFSVDAADLVTTAELVSTPAIQDLSEREHRTSPRRSVRVRTVVQFKESEEESWKEITEVTTVSRNGAALVLSHECPVGRLVSLVMQMPHDLRVYDHYAAVYPILGVIQNCYASKVDGQTVYHVGVAFIGKKVPSGAKADPKQCYRITGQNQDGLWEVVETGKTFRSRKHSRLWRRFEVTINIRDERQRTSRRSQVFTRDVSPGGMCVWGPLDAEIGDRVKVASKAHDFYSMAMVRNRTDDEKDDARSLIHFEFIGAEFPIAKVAMLPENPRFEDTQPEPAEQEDDRLHVPGMGPDSFENEMTA